MVVSVLMIITKKVTYSISMNVQVYLFLSPSIMVCLKKVNTLGNFDLKLGQGNVH